MPRPSRSERSAASATPCSSSEKSARRFQRSPSGRATGPLANRCTTSRPTRSPSKRPSTTRPLSAPRSTAAYPTASLTADQQPILAQEERVVVPASRGERGPHLRPDGAVALAVLLDLLGADLEREADAGHGGEGAASRPRAEEEVRATG